VAQPDPVERGAPAADGLNQRPDVAAFVPALAQDFRDHRGAVGRVRSLLVRSETDAERFAALGSRNVIVTGNLKLDVQAPPADKRQAGAVDGVTRGRPVIVAASTHAGEEEILLEPFIANLRAISIVC